MQPFLVEKREEIASLCRQHHVSRLAVFGSAVRDDFDPVRSDVDVIVEFANVPAGSYIHNKCALRDELAARLARPVDLLTWKSVRNEYLLQAIEQEQVTLYAA